MSEGWSKADENGFYWWRFDKDDEPQPVVVRDGCFYSTAEREPTSVGFGEFLGPISPADTERLVRVEKAAQELADVLADSHVTDNLFRLGVLARGMIGDAAAELRAALEGKHE